MPAIIWGTGGPSVGGSAPISGTHADASPEGGLNADGSTISDNIVFGQGGPDVGGTADVSE